VNRNLFPELFPTDSPAIVEAYNTAFADAIATHLSVPEVTGAELATMSDAEFVDVIKSSDRQPLNPITVARETLDLEEGTPVIEIMKGLKEAYSDLVTEYEDNGVDGRSALLNASNLIGHTEAYITGYSRDLGRLTNRMVLVDPSYNMPTRWLDKIWVPQEDAHDRLWSLMMSGLSDDDMELFNQDHSRHMQIGVHLPVTAILPTQTYLMQQEGSTVPSYGNTAALYGPILRKPALRIREDEARHRREYQAVTKRLMEVDSDAVVIAIKNEFDTFAMPGKDGIRDFDSKQAGAVVNGILDPVSVLEVQIPMINQLIEKADVKTEEAKKAKDALLDENGKYSSEEKAKRQRQLERIRERVVEKAIKAGDLMPAILGVTVIADRRSGELSFPKSK
jgi:hypothetical protein